MLAFGRTLIYIVELELELYSRPARISLFLRRRRALIEAETKSGSRDETVIVRSG